VIALERLQVVVAHHKIHVHSDTPVAVLVQRERPDNRIGEPIGLQDGSQLVERELGIGLSHEESPAIIRTLHESSFRVLGESTASPRSRSSRPRGRHHHPTVADGRPTVDRRSCAQRLRRAHPRLPHGRGHQDGPAHEVDLGDVDKIVDKLNERDPDRYKRIPLRDEAEGK